MFERYAESARRAVFFARYEAGLASSLEIGTLDLLRGIVRESKSESDGIVWVRANCDRLSSELWRSEEAGQRAIPLTAEIKLAADAKLALAHAAELGADNPRGIINASTLLLGILAFQNDASQLLERLGLNLALAQIELRQLHERFPPKPPNWYSLVKGRLRRYRMALLKIVLFLIFVFGGVALVNWINR